MVKKENVEKYTGFLLKPSKQIPVLRDDKWKEIPIPIDGDAPKNFLRVYEFEQDSSIRKSNPKSWSSYIAKVGHKWYPIESVTEYLLNRMGEELGLNMAESKLYFIKDQLRFFSKYFLKKGYSLEHGAQIFAGYISDKDMVEDIEKEGLARTFFTFDFVVDSIGYAFPSEKDNIVREFVKMLVFDAITGNNDRHFYNWGVIKSVKNKKTAKFAPIYDSARGLFWNQAESKINSWIKSEKHLHDKIKTYCENSKPKIGWAEMDDLNHFDLVQKLIEKDTKFLKICKELLTNGNINKLFTLIEVEFVYLMSPNRVNLVKQCLEYRINRIQNLIK